MYRFMLAGVAVTCDTPEELLAAVQVATARHEPTSATQRARLVKPKRASPQPKSSPAKRVPPDKGSPQRRNWVLAHIWASQKRIPLNVARSQVAKDPKVRARAEKLLQQRQQQ